MHGRVSKVEMETGTEMKQAIVTFYHHSGFSVAVKDTLLVFDYWEGENRELPEKYRITNDSFEGYKQAFVFISHSHPDHMDPVVFTWKADCPITYIVGYDAAIGTRGRRMSPGDEMPLAPDIRAKAFDSTDLGVSYLVQIYGLNIFHAGDLNLWHWRQESTLREIEAAEEAYQAAVAPITKETIDLAMFPVDPRMGPMFDAGANHFILAVKPKLMIPMHWQGRADVAIDFARRGKTPKTEVLAMTSAGEKVTTLFGENQLELHVVTPKEPVARKHARPMTPPPPQAATPSPVTLEAYDENDPFSDTDLPVSFKNEE